jgi:hypothetical protein
MVLFFAPAPAHAGFIMKKQATVQTTATAENAANAIATLKQSAEMEQINAKMEQLSSPSRFFVGLMASGTLGLIALLFGALGFLLPVFSVGAIMFGFIGMKRYCRSRGLAIAGFILGLAVIVLSIAGGYAPL